MKNIKCYHIYNSKTKSLVRSFSKDAVKMTKNRYDALTYANQEMALSRLSQIKEFYIQNKLEWMANDFKLKEVKN